MQVTVVVDRSTAVWKESPDSPQSSNGTSSECSTEEENRESLTEENSDLSIMPKREPMPMEIGKNCDLFRPFL